MIQSLPLFGILCLLTFTFARPGHAAVHTITLEPVAIDAFDSLVGLVHAGDGSGRLFAIEQRGRILIMQNGTVQPTPFLDIGTKIIPESDIPDFGPPFGMFDERGLLGLAFHPDYVKNGAPGEGKFYVYYSAPSQVTGSNSKSVIAEFCVSSNDPDTADVNSERILLEIEEPQFNHNAGQLAFGPDDGLLYIGTGDGGGSNDNEEGHTGGNATKPNGILGNSQDKTKLLGKILRIDVLGTNGPGGQYGIPPTNPFAGNVSGRREEIYAYGLRNPWRFSFDREASPQRLFCADVGQGIIEEINLIENGGNYGWRIKEGNLDFDATAPNPDNDTLLPPIGEYAHGSQTVPGLLSVGDSVTGGYVYRGLLNPDLAGVYIFGDWGRFGNLAGSGTLLALTEGSPGVFQLEKMTVGGGNPIGQYIYAFGEDEDGEIYVLTKKSFNPIPSSPDASVYRIRETGPVESVVIGAEKDNTMFSESGTESNGKGSWFFAGRTGFNAGTAMRRALLEFDVTTSIPPDVTIGSATLTLVADRTQDPASATNVHRVLAEWGEGDSNATGAEGAGTQAQSGDATWSFRFFSSDSWTNTGGDFSSTVSATRTVTANGTYDWTGAGLVGDIQGWLDNGDNHGWILIGDETNTLTAKRFVSKDNNISASRPKLSVSYSGILELTNREKWLRRFFPAGVDIADSSNDDEDEFNALLEYGFGFSPLLAESADAMFEVDKVGDEFTFSFRRDTEADDLIYRLKVGSDLSTWTTIVEITGTGTPGGTGFVSQENIPGTAKYKRVNGRDPSPPSTETRRYIILEIERMAP